MYFRVLQRLKINLNWHLCYLFIYFCFFFTLYNHTFSDKLFNYFNYKNNHYSKLWFDYLNFRLIKAVSRKIVYISRPENILYRTRRFKNLIFVIINNYYASRTFFLSLIKLWRYRQFATKRLSEYNIFKTKNYHLIYLFIPYKRFSK